MHVIQDLKLCAIFMFLIDKRGGWVYNKGGETIKVYRKCQR